MPQTKTLPLTHFEELMFWEDRPAYPCCPFIRLRFAGQLDRSAVDVALSQAIVQHPLLMSNVELRAGRLHWVPADPRLAVSWSDVAVSPSDDFPRATPIDLQNEIGLRVFVTAGSQSSDLVLYFHHSCCDGAGILTFIDDLLIAYARERGESSPQVRLRSYDAERLADRDRYDLTWWKLLKMLPRQLIGLQGAKQFMERNPSPLIPHTPRPDEDALPTDFPSNVTHQFTVDETTRLRQVAQRLNVTTNDLLARDLFLALVRWRREQGCGNDQEWLRMMVPMNLRSPRDRELSAANVVSSVFLDRRGEDAVDPERLLTTIHEEMELIKRNQLGLTFVFSLRLVRWLPGGLRKSARQNKCTVSCFLSNFGRVLARSPLPKCDDRLVVGDTQLESLQVLAPLRPYNCAPFVVHQYAGRLELDMRYDSDVLTPVQARRLMEMYVEQSRYLEPDVSMVANR